MNAELKELDQGKTLEVRLSGKLVKDDYAIFVPAVDRLVNRHGKIRMLVETHNFRGWTAGALWEDVNLDVKRLNRIERLAIVGGARRAKGMERFCKPFATATVRFFSGEHAAEARDWLAGAEQN